MTGISGLVCVSPNPANRQLNINCVEDGELFILNELGALIFNQPVKKGITNLNIADLANGIYFLKAETKHGQGMFKIVKE